MLRHLPDRRRILSVAVCASFTITSGTGADEPAPALLAASLSAARPAVEAGGAPVVDLALRRQVGDRFEVPLADGRTAVLTLDVGLQAEAERLLAEADAPYGAIVAMSPDGSVLALAGRSTAEPSLALAELTDRPWAPSASVFKVVTAAALLDAGVKPETSVCYHGGGASVEADNLVDDRRRDKSCRSLAFGLAHSQNAIVGKLAARRLTPAALARSAEAFGYNDGGLARARIPSMTDGGLELARAAAGFWHSELSPLGGARVAATVASGGLLVTPRLVAAVIEDGIERPLPAPPARRTLAEATARTLARMLVGTTEEGTARASFRGWKQHVAGKTGTLTRRQPTEIDYSWFIGFAPAERPEIIVSVLLGGDASHRTKAHALAARLLASAL